MIMNIMDLLKDRAFQIGFLKINLYLVIIHNNTKILKVKVYKKKVSVATLMSDQIDFKARKNYKYYRAKKNHYLKILYQEDTVISIFVHI